MLLHVDSSTTHERTVITGCKAGISVLAGGRNVAVGVEHGFTKAGFAISPIVFKLGGLVDTAVFNTQMTSVHVPHSALPLPPS